MIKSVVLSFIVCLVVLLGGCRIFDDHRGNSGELVSTAETVDWSNIFSVLITDMLTTTKIGEATLLLSDVRNNTQQPIPSRDLSLAIATELDELHQLTIIDQSSIDAAKRQLGLSPDEQLVSRSKIIAIGRYLGTDLVLFSSVDRWSDESGLPPKVALELLSTKTGEIIWRKSSDELLIMPVEEDR